MSETADSLLECVAYHEAGHAALLILARRRFRFVTIQPGDGFLGQCVRWNTPPRFHPDIDVTPKGERYLRDHIVSLMAGELADYRHCGRIDERVLIVDGDFHTASGLASYVTGPLPETEAYLEWLVARAKAQLSRADVWAAVEAIAAALLAKHRLTFAEAIAVWYETHLAMLRSDRDSPEIALQRAPAAWAEERRIPWLDPQNAAPPPSCDA
jgi:hypothetical protein